MAAERLILFAAAAFWFAAGFAAECTEDLKEAAFLARAERNMAEIKTLQAEFIQERSIKLLKNRIRFEGRFFIQMPGRIAWQVYRPVRYVCIINDNSITQWDADSRRKTVISAENNSALQVVFQQLNRWFSGKFNELCRDFDYRADIREKVLQFIPKKGVPQENFISSISICLHDSLNYIREIRITEQNGDTQTISFYKTQINQKLPAAAWNIPAK
ncbi:MAG: outer membrane lipoprotein carrier protein LolA [Victivallaceae bacterium]|nr:outer membrane lipoprotein carrier protein LolA [Victivallaceae bacterium]